MIKWPGTTKPGAVSNALVSQIDLMATFATLVGYPLPADAAEDSHDLLPLLRGETEKIRDSHIHNTRTNSYAIRHEDWVLVLDKSGYLSKRNADWETKYDYPADSDHPAELYNLKNDIGQKENLATKHPERVKEMETLLKKIRHQGHSAPRLAN